MDVSGRLRKTIKAPAVLEFFERQLGLCALKQLSRLPTRKDCAHSVEMLGRVDHLTYGFLSLGNLMM